jgi:hypothetical protein
VGWISATSLKGRTNGARAGIANMRLKGKGLPVARAEGLLVEPVADETVVYDEKSKEAHCLSPLTAVVFANCDGHTTIEQLASLSAERLGEPVEVASVLDALAQLEERELMAAPAKLRGELSRRDLFQRSAAVAGGAAMGTTLITTVVAPNAIAAQTATCANLLCCPCCTQSNLNFPECCTIPNVTVNCQCTGFRTVAYPGEPAPNNCGKYCKPAGTAAPSDAQCAALFTQAPPSPNSARAICGQVPGFPTAGFAACQECANCPN